MISSTRIILSLALIFVATATYAARNYIGAEKCRTCHEYEYRVWSNGPHATAHKALTTEQLADNKCNTCHTMLPEDRSAKVIGVQCERCHGGGRYYQHAYVMKDKELARAVGLVDVEAKHCQQCHTEGTPAIAPFNYATLWSEIAHGKDARKKWEASKADATAPAE